MWIRISTPQGTRQSKHKEAVISGTANSFSLHRKTYLSPSFRDKQPTEETNALFYVSNISQVMPRKLKSSPTPTKNETHNVETEEQNWIKGTKYSAGRFGIRPFENKQTIYFTHPSGKLKLSFDRTTRNISQ